MYKAILKYIDKLMTSSPDMPLWNIESIRQGKKPAWNYIDGCMMTSLIELYKATNDEKYLNIRKFLIEEYKKATFLNKTIKTVLEGMKSVATETGGTAYSVFKNFDQRGKVFKKTVLDLE